VTLKVTITPGIGMMYVIPSISKRFWTTTRSGAATGSFTTPVCSSPDTVERFDAALKS